MALNITSVNRIFRMDKSGLELGDPNPEMSLEEVTNFYSGQYPELTTATVQGPVYEEDNVVYIFKTVVGTKG